MNPYVAVFQAFAKRECETRPVRRETGPPVPPGLCKQQFLTAATVYPNQGSRSLQHGPGEIHKNPGVRHGEFRHAHLFGQPHHDWPDHLDIRPRHSQGLEIERSGEQCPVSRMNEMSRPIYRATRDERDEQIKGLRRHRHWLAITQQQPFLRVEPKGAELEQLLINDIWPAPYRIGTFAFNSSNQFSTMRTCATTGGNAFMQTLLAGFTSGARPGR